MTKLICGHGNLWLIDFPWIFCPVVISMYILIGVTKARLGLYHLLSLFMLCWPTAFIDMTDLHGYLMLAGRWKTVKCVEVAWRAWISHMMLKARYLGMISEQMPTLADYSSVRSHLWLLVWVTLYLLSPLEMHRDLELKIWCSEMSKPFQHYMVLPCWVIEDCLAPTGINPYIAQMKSELLTSILKIQLFDKKG